MTPSLSRGLAVVFITTLALAVPAAAQPPAPATYYRVTYSKIKPGKAADYQKYSHDVLRKLYTAVVAKGEVQGWANLQVITPTGADTPHDAIGIASVDKWEDINFGLTPAPDYVKDAVKPLSWEQYQALGRDLRETVHTEVWQRVGGTAATPQSTPAEGDIVLLDYYKAKPGQGTAMEELWKSVNIPVGEERISHGIIKATSLWRVWGGNAESSPYSHVVIVRYANIKAAGAPNQLATEFYEAAHKGKDWGSLRAQLQSIRTLYRGELAVIKERIAAPAK